MASFVTDNMLVKNFKIKKQIKMKTPEEYIEEFRRDTDHYADQEFDDYNITELILAVRKEAWNAALEAACDVVDFKIINTEKGDYTTIDRNLIRALTILY